MTRCRATTVQSFLFASLIAIAVFGQEFNPLICMDLPDGTNVPSPFQCNQFYVCEAGMLSEEGICPQNMLFNPDSRTCDFVDNVDCRGVPLPPGFETTTTASVTTTEDSSSSPVDQTTTVQVTTSTPAKTCPEQDPEDPIFLPVKGNCSSYILCFHGKEVVMSCPGNLHWNNEAKQCDDPSLAQCQPESEEFGCPRAGIDFLPHPEGCKRYVYCRDGFARVQSCAFLRVFDVEQKTCVFGFSC